MAKTRGGLSASPSSPMPRPAQPAVRGSTSPPAQGSTVPPSEGGTPSQRRYPTRRPPTDPVPATTKAKRPASRPPAKKAKFSEAPPLPRGLLSTNGITWQPTLHPRAPDVPPPPELPQDEQLPQAQQDEILTDIAPPVPASPITQGAPPDQIIATQTQHTTILHQIQQHLSMQTLPGHDRSGPSEPPVPDEGTIPDEQPISDEEIRAEPSHDPTTI
ncbi:hypothetical protein AAG906_039307 [Vitis piasezkii]